LAEFWTLADRPPYLPDLNLLKFSICIVLLMKGLAMPHATWATLHPFTMEWDQLAADYPQYLPLILLLLLNCR
jgi:hypothetical protein